MNPIANKCLVASLKQFSRLNLHGVREFGVQKILTSYMRQINCGLLGWQLHDITHPLSTGRYADFQSCHRHKFSLEIICLTKLPSPKCPTTAPLLLVQLAYCQYLLHLPLISTVAAASSARPPSAFATSWLPPILPVNLSASCASEATSLRLRHLGRRQFRLCSNPASLRQL